MGTRRVYRARTHPSAIPRLGLPRDQLALLPLRPVLLRQCSQHHLPLDRTWLLMAVPRMLLLVAW